METKNYAAGLPPRWAVDQAQLMNETYAGGNAGGTFLAVCPAERRALFVCAGKYFFWMDVIGGFSMLLDLPFSHTVRAR